MKPENNTKNSHGLLPPLIPRQQDTARAFCLAGLILAFPAFALPFVTLGKYGNTRVTFLADAAAGLWEHGMNLLGVWVLLCGVVFPLLMFLVLAAIFFQGPNNPSANPFAKKLAMAADKMGPWAMPEVLALGTLVAFFKIRDMVDIHMEPGFWCYFAASILLLLSWRFFLMQFSNEAPPKNERKAG